MRVSRYGRRFHDPWGNKHGNRFGSMIRFQYQVGKSSLSNAIADGEANVHGEVYHLDKALYFEHAGNKFVRTGMRSPERIRR